MLSVAIIARDEERHIGAAIESVANLADEVIVLLDQRTSDHTAAIGREHGARVLVEVWRGFSAQRNRALELCAGDWVLFLDADERVTAELCAEIQQLIARSDTRPETRDPRPENERLSPVSCLLSPVFHAGYWIPRHNQFFGKTLRGGGWYPDHQLRLLRRGRARYDEARLVHEFAQLDGQAGYLTQHLLHLNIERMDELWRKQTSYAIQEAQTLYQAGLRARWRNFAGAPLREFWRRYLTLGGYRDGAIGLLLCATLAYFEWVKFAHLKGLEYITFERSDV
jgi:glycosyltransferase involved in cell wall biosynthesis